MLPTTGGLGRAVGSVCVYAYMCLLCGTMVGRRLVTGELSLSYARLAADGWPLTWVNRPLQGQPTRPAQPFILSRLINEQWTVIGCALPRSGCAIWWMLFSGRELAFTFAMCYRPSVCRLPVCLSVCLSVTLVHPTQAVEIFRNFLPYDSSGTLVFWCQKSLVGDAPFPLKFAFKVTHPLSNGAISTNIGS